MWGGRRGRDPARGSAVAALLGRGPGHFLLVLGRVEHLGGEAALHPVPAVARHDLPHLHQLVDVPGQQLEGAVHVAVALGRRLHVADAQLGRQLLRLVAAHLAVLVEVALVADEDVDHVVGQDVLTHLLVPLPHMLEGLPIGQIEDEKPAHGVPVVGRRDGSGGREEFGSLKNSGVANGPDRRPSVSR